MFVRVKTRPNTNKQAVQIVRSIRKGTKVQQKVVQTVGYAFDQVSLDRLKDIAEHIKTQLLAQEKPTPLFDSIDVTQETIAPNKKEVAGKKAAEPLTVDLQKLREVQRTIWGVHQAYGKVYQDLGFSEVLTKRHLSTSKVLYQLVMARLAYPVSKRASVALLAQDFGVSLNLNTVYRMMDKLGQKAEEKAQKLAFNATTSLLKKEVKVIFYDCTTLYFESFIEDNLKQNGYSKDGKFNQPQIVLALLVSENGLPIGYEVFPGATFEGHTLVTILEKIKSKYALDRVIFVADSGMLSQENKALLEKAGMGYILGARLKSLPKSLQQEVVDRSRYVAETGKEGFELAEFKHKEERLIACYSKDRAAKDAHDRLTAVTSLQKRLSKSKDPKALLNNYGYKKYLQSSLGASLILNEEKIAADVVWDGLGGILTNIKGLSKEEAMAHYRGLWQIESCFRVQKTDLKIRPVFHWTPNRIRAHVLICFIAFTCQQYLCYRMKRQGSPLSAEAIRQALLHVQVSILQDSSNGRQYGVPSKKNEDAKKIYKTLGLTYDSTPFLITNKE